MKFESPRTVVIEPRKGLAALDLPEVWRYRELLFFLAWRDVKVRYTQSILGAAWAVLQPFMTMVVFNVLFGLLLGKDGKPTLEGVPYALSTYCALVPWQLFSAAMTTGTGSLVADQQLITKVYFPRLIVPVAPILAAFVDFLIAFAVLIGMMLFYGIVPGPQVLAVPVFAATAMATALTVSMWLSALNAIYRDVQHTLPFLAQIWMFVTPVVYTTESVMGGKPGWVRALYALNPMTGVIEGFRWSLLGGSVPPWGLLGVSTAALAVLLVGGMYYFRGMERRFADMV